MWLFELQCNGTSDSRTNASLLQGFKGLIFVLDSLLQKRKQSNILGIIARNVATLSSSVRLFFRAGSIHKVRTLYTVIHSSGVPWDSRSQIPSRFLCEQGLPTCQVHRFSRCFFTMRAAHHEIEHRLPLHTKAHLSSDTQRLSCSAIAILKRSGRSQGASRFPTSRADLTGRAPALGSPQAFVEAVVN